MTDPIAAQVASQPYIRAFLEEDIQHLFEGKNILSECLLTHDVGSLMKHIHFDDSHPENKNIRVLTSASDMFTTEVFIKSKQGTSPKWKTVPNDKLLEYMVNQAHHVLNWHKIKHNKEIGRNADDSGHDYDAALAWLNSLYDDELTRNDAKEAIMDLLREKKVDMPLTSSKKGKK